MAKIFSVDQLKLNGTLLTGDAGNIYFGTTRLAIGDNAASNSIVITAGSGLIGGGDLTTSRTINVGSGSGIYAAPDSVNVLLDDVTTTLSSNQIIVKDGGISTAKLAASSVTTAKILDANVTASKIASDAVTTAKILDANVTEGKLTDSAVTTAKINSLAVTEAKIADGAVTVNKLGVSAVTTAKINDTAVTEAKLGDASVTAIKLATDAVTNVKIADGAVSANKLATNAVTTIKIADASVTSAKLASNFAGSSSQGGAASSVANTLSNGLGILSLEYNGSTAKTVDVDSSQVAMLTGTQTIAGNKTFSNNIVIAGDLTVNGVTTTVNSNEVNIGDNKIVLNSDASTANASDGGIQVYTGLAASPELLWKNSSRYWSLTTDGTNYFEIASSKKIKGGTTSLATNDASKTIDFSYTFPSTPIVTVSLQASSADADIIGTQISSISASQAVVQFTTPIPSTASYTLNWHAIASMS